MTREEHIDNLKSFIECFKDEIEHSGFGDARFDEEQAKKDIETFEAAIQALSQEPCDDAISREDVKECKELMTDINGDTVYAVRMSDIRQLPSVTTMRDATPEEQKSVNDYIKSISTPTGVKFDDAISRKPNCIDCIHKSVCFRLDMRVDSDYAEKCGDFLTELPSVTQKSGKWIEHPEIETNAPEYLMFYECSECGDKPCFCKSDIHKKRFCSNCGTRMFEPQERSKE